MDGVGIEDGPGAVRARLGPPKKPVRAYPIEPLGADEDGAGGPYSVYTGPHELGPGPPSDRGQITLRYEGVSFFVADDQVFGFMVTDEDAETAQGVEVGDALADVRRSYRRLSCEAAGKGETTAVQEPHCAGPVAHDRFVYFGGDPVESITVLDRPFASPVLCPAIPKGAEGLPKAQCDSQ